MFLAEQYRFTTFKFPDPKMTRRVVRPIPVPSKNPSISYLVEPFSYQELLAIAAAWPGGNLPPSPDKPDRGGDREQEAKWALAGAWGQQVSTGYFTELLACFILFNYSRLILTWINYVFKNKAVQPSSKLGDTVICEGCPLQRLTGNVLCEEGPLSGAWPFSVAAFNC